MKILILTDHLTHKSSNSFYLIANSLLDHSFFTEVYIASRSVVENADFFEGRSLILQVKQMQGHIAHDSFNQWIRADFHMCDSLEEFDRILLRLPRPIHPNFFDFLGSHFSFEHIINNPKGIIKTGNKSFLLELLEHTVPIKLVKNTEEIRKFSVDFAIVLKPLEEYGGKGIIKIDGDTVEIGDRRTITFSEFAKMYEENPTPYLAMKFLKNVKNGDKRIVVANGEVLASSLRIPAENSWLCNVAQGGDAQLCEITKEEKNIIKAIDPILQKEGIFIYGLDTLEDDNGIRVVSEINTLSVGGIAPSAEMSGKNLGYQFASLLANFINNNK